MYGAAKPLRALGLCGLAAAAAFALKCGAVSFCLGSGAVVVYIDVLGDALAAVFIVGAVGNIAADRLIGRSFFRSCHLIHSCKKIFGTGACRSCVLAGSLPGINRNM